MKREPTLAAHYTRTFLETLADMGLDTAVLLEQVGLDARSVYDLDARIPAHFQEDLWEHAAHHADDPHLGLHVGEQSTLGRWGLVEYILMNSATVEEALENVIRFWRLVIDGKMVTLAQDGETARFAFDASLCHNRHAAECEMVYIARFARLALSATFTPLVVWFAHPPEADLTEYDRIFEAPVLFNQSVNAFVFSAAWLKRSLPMANTLLQAQLDAQATRQLATLDSSPSLTARVETLIRRNPLHVTLEKVAEQLALGPRTLQRKLQQEGASFQRLLDEARKNLALTYLRDLDLPLSEVAFRLGFSESSAFYRATKRWFGTTAQAYRATLRVPAE